jgi:YHS domain-containing protein
MNQTKNKMISTFAIAAILMGSPVQAAQAPAPLNCPIMLNGVADMKSKPVVMAGFSFHFCCPGCDAKFKKDPSGSMKKAVEAKKTVGVSLFDPVNGVRMDAAKAKGTADFNGIRYYFASRINAQKFSEAPASFTATPKQEVLYCVVMKQAIRSYEAAHSYVDHKGVRYYMCCAPCNGQFKEKPDTFIANGKPRSAGFAIEAAKG